VNPSIVLLVKFRSALPRDELEKVVQSRIDQFRALDGLIQKYYLRDEATGECAGLYLWESQNALVEYNASDLRKTIAEAYSVIGEPRVEVFEIFETLR
jgi:quinol monooxygenase YgiN